MNVKVAIGDGEPMEGNLVSFTGFPIGTVFAERRWRWRGLTFMKGNIDVYSRAQL